jgi:serine/threonine protein kinase
MKAFPVDVKVKLKDAALCTLSPAKGTQIIVQKVAGRPRPSLLTYLAPELLQGNPPRRSADAYSFGLLMWELCTGGMMKTSPYYNDDYVCSLYVSFTCHVLNT